MSPPVSAHCCCTSPCMHMCMQTESCTCASTQMRNTVYVCVHAVMQHTTVVCVSKQRYARTYIQTYIHLHIKNPGITTGNLLLCYGIVQTGLIQFLSDSPETPGSPRSTDQFRVYGLGFRVYRGNRLNHESSEPSTPPEGS